MNKFLIPSILTATVLVAGIFAMLPVQDASTVHTTILARTASQFTSNNGDNSANIAIVAEGATGAKHGWVCVDVNDVATTGTTALVRGDIDPATDNQVFLTWINNANSEAGQCVEWAGVSLELVAGGAGDTADIVAIWSQGA